MYIEIEREAAQRPMTPTRLALKETPEYKINSSVYGFKYMNALATAGVRINILLAGYDSMARFPAYLQLGPRIGTRMDKVLNFTEIGMRRLNSNWLPIR